MRPVVVRGGGDLATGIIWQLCMAGYPVIILECQNPMAIRREAAFCEAVRLGEKTVEGLTCTKINTADEALSEVKPLHPMLLVDEKAGSLQVIKPDVMIDAILAKRNIGTKRDMASFVIGVGPGFTAGEDVDAVIETMRGHDLGRVIRKGSALPNTGIPGIIAGYGAERVIHAPAAGVFTAKKRIGDLVTEGESIGTIRSGGVDYSAGNANERQTADAGADFVEGCVQYEVPASLTGVLRGILPDGFEIPKGMKMADIDPRADEQKNCFTISDKARCIAGSALMLVSAFYMKKQ